MQKYLFMWRGNAKIYLFPDYKSAESHANYIRTEFKIPVTFTLHKK